MTEQLRAAESPRSMAELFQQTAARNPGATALRDADGATSLTWADYANHVARLAAGLSALGVERGDTVALMMVNRPEMHLFDAAAFHLGATPFSVYNTSSPEQIAFLATSAQPMVVVTEAQYLHLWLDGVPGAAIKHLVCVDTQRPGVLSVGDVEAGGDPDFDFEGHWRAVDGADLLTIIYTSGTTGDPKGVQITHANMLAELAATNSIMQAGPDDAIISFLPSAHIADRWAGHYLQIQAGNQLTCVADRAALMPTLAAVRPTLFGGVPQMWQKLRAALESMIAAADESRRAMLEDSVAFAVRYVTERDRGQNSADDDARYVVLDGQVFAPLRASLGLDRARVVQSGAAPIPLDVLIFFNALGIPLVDVWGMSELSCLAAMPPVTGGRFGTIGKAIPGVEMAVAADGELLVRGPIVMAGYLGRPDLTAEAVDADGWLHTGDLGSIDQDGFVRVVDRKKEILINSSGKNMSPANIEGAIKAASALIGQVVVIGNDRPYNVALIVLDPESAAMFAARHGLGADAGTLAADPRVHAVVEQAVVTGNARLSRTEQIKKWQLVSEYWWPGSALLTHTMKLRRVPIGEQYRQQVDALYSA